MRSDPPSPLSSLPNPLKFQRKILFFLLPLPLQEVGGSSFSPPPPPSSSSALLRPPQADPDADEEAPSASAAVILTQPTAESSEGVRRESSVRWSHDQALLRPGVGGGSDASRHGSFYEDEEEDERNSAVDMKGGSRRKGERQSLPEKHG